MNLLTRRRWVLGASALALSRPTLAASARSFAVISLVGDKLELVYPVQGTGSNLDRNLRRHLADPTGAYDQIALASLGKALESAAGGGKASLLSLPPSALHEQPERLFSGDSITLPGNLVDALERTAATHVLLLTKRRSDARVPVRDGYIGIGALRGLGYYIDGNTSIILTETGERAPGFLAAYAHMQLTLADARTGGVLKKRVISAAQMYPVAGTDKVIDPWNVLSAEDKVGLLRILLETRLADEVKRLLE
jgi:hypothetical protein